MIERVAIAGWKTIGIAQRDAENGRALLKHAFALNLEGIVSKRKSAPYRSGRSDN
jgi:ATP-dependent DNA ligase